MPQNVYIKTYGCQMNVYDSTRMAQILEPLGYQLIDNPESASLIILNTCYIREKARHKVYSDVGRFLPFKQKNRGKLVIAGCVAQAENEWLQKVLRGVDFVVGPRSYHLLPELLRETHSKKTVVKTDFLMDKYHHLPQKGRGQTLSRAFIPIQEGCDHFCTFCVVPYTRGEMYNRSTEEIVQEIFSIDPLPKEITLLGQNVNAWVDQKNTFAGLLALLAEKGIQHIRYMTSHPKYITEELASVHAQYPAVMPFVHLPLQSGSNRILDKMNRGYTLKEYEDSITLLRKYKQDIAISSDFIVGFPNETEEDFLQTVEAVKKNQFASFFAFKYSPRPGTPAADYSNQISETVKQRRLETLFSALYETQQAFNIACVDRTFDVLISHKDKKESHIHTDTEPHRWIGKSPYMQAVYLSYTKGLLHEGDLVKCKINAASRNRLYAEVVS